MVKLILTIRNTTTIVLFHSLSFNWRRVIDSYSSNAEDLNQSDLVLVASENLYGVLLILCALETNFTLSAELKEKALL